ncbi:MAG: M28 family peptidase [Candidatus Eisenbacteria bacterium]|uniref:M28 family peptidase n=1 Tax=Eiseniibacteriota bacterium TaxID=2212470 RepID=A0A948RSF9_UNCEI|nr:M28 family peptidase [Candidatus Eisenbacteria bacterium]MBU2690155.1 M28 family peptidase [Candidatus Eisenbacteria bacterium]
MRRTQLTSAVRCIPVLMLPGLALLAGPGLAWNGQEGTLWSLDWDAPTAESLALLEGRSVLLTYNQDLALILTPDSWTIPPMGSVEMIPLERWRDQGHYYLYQLSDAWSAEFEPPARVLHREGRTVILWTSGSTPELTPVCAEKMPGLCQPVRINLAPKPWPAITVSTPDKTSTDFDPLIDVMVGLVDESEYVSVWQQLDDFETRYTFTSQNEDAAQWIADRMTSLGLDVSFHEFDQEGPHRNVIGTLPGLIHPEEYVYLVGHFDSTSDDPYNHAPGADDNASGISGVLETARVLTRFSFEKSIRFVGFNSEEQGFVGSSAYVYDIAQAGENVTGCYNLDMIAYRGEDPAPPDFIIYTNENSQPLAQTLSDAASWYLPEDLEPVIVVQSIQASDHAAFWDYGYPAVHGAEEEVWGSDYSPWYHSTEDRIENYPTDFPATITKAVVAAVAQTAGPITPPEAYLAIDALIVDDDQLGLSHGNGNGIPEYSETIELTVILKNIGLSAAADVEADLAYEGEFAFIEDGNASFGAIPAGGTAESVDPFVIDISDEIPDDYDMVFEMVVNADPDELGFHMTASAPVLRVAGFQLDDVAGGDGDGVAEPGEALFLRITVANDGGASVPELLGVLSSDEPYLDIDPAPGNFGGVPAGELKHGGPFVIQLHPDAPVETYTTMAIALTGDGGIARIESLVLNIGGVFSDDMESGEEYWTHRSGFHGFGDQWHLEDYRNATAGGGYAWKCGGSGASDYDNGLCAVLESMTFNVPFRSELSFWHWIDAEIMTASQAWDGGNVEISSDGGQNWELLTPAGGYPFTIVDNDDSPFPAGTPIFSGQEDWRQEFFDLSSYSGGLKVRFVFGTDAVVQQEGWYVDDVEVLLDVSAVGENDRSVVLRLYPATPNPARGPALLRFDLPTRSHVRLSVFDVTGRVVRNLMSGTLESGRYESQWDGTDNRGGLVGSGVYWVRMDAGNNEKTTRVVRVK